MITDDGWEIHRGSEAEEFFGPKQEGDEVAGWMDLHWFDTHLDEGYSPNLWYRRRVQNHGEQMHFL